MKRSMYIGTALVLAAIAALLTLRAQHTIPVAVATHDLRAGTIVAAEDVQIIRMHEDSVPAGAIGSPDPLVGGYVAWPLTAGEPILTRAVSQQRSGASVTSGFTVPDGYRAVSVPVAPAAAVGGMLSPGDRVDVYATPTVQHQGQSSGTALDQSRATTTVSLGHDILVLQLRSDQGQPLAAASDSSVHGLNFGPGKLGSVVLAVPAGDVTTYATAASGDTVYLALSVN